MADRITANLPAKDLDATERFYAALGFAEAGRRKGYYQRKDGVEDAIVMKRELEP